MELRLTGDWVLWQAILLASVLAALAVWLYRRHLADQGGWTAWVLPALRGLTVFLVVLMLLGPILHFRQVIGQMSRVIMFVDASGSMGATDEQMDAGRKMLAVQRLGWLPDTTLDTHLLEAADRVANAAAIADAALTTEGGSDLPTATKAFAAQLDEAMAQLKQVAPGRFPIAATFRGSLNYERWHNIPGDRLDDVANNPKFQGPPDVSELIDKFEGPSNVADNYVARVRGFVYPSRTGSYTFYANHDDALQLRLSTDESPANARLIINNPVVNSDRNNPSKSAAIKLTGGRRYYVEALLKEGVGEDYLSVSWTTTKRPGKSPIAGTSLATYSSAADLTPQQVIDRLVAQFNKELLAPAKSLAEFKDDSRLTKTRERLEDLADVALGYQQMLHGAFTSYAQALADSGDTSIKSAIERFDSMNRFQRVQTVLLDGESPMLQRLQDKHNLELWTMENDTAQRLWSSQQTRELPSRLAVNPTAARTNLSDPLRTPLAGAGTGAEGVLTHTSVVIFTDGQNNMGPPPGQTATVMGNRGINIYTVGMGSELPPPDLAIAGIQGPQTVFYKDRVKGTVTLKDDMPPGTPIMLRITHEGKMLWEQALITEGSHMRQIDFDLPVEEIATAGAARVDREVTVGGLPLALVASVSILEGEKQTDNNQGDYLVRAVMNNRKVLIVDGRPRWEYRYLHNMLGRDGQWEVNALVGMIDRHNRAWPRGTGIGTFPQDLATLMSYELIILGEVPDGMLSPQEQTWIRDFVGNRGGGLIIIDGPRGVLKDFAKGDMSVLFPVEYRMEPSASMAQRVRLTAAGTNFAPLRLVASPEENAEVFAGLKAPHRVTVTETLPGAETLMEAVFADRVMPLLVSRPYGAGQVVYTSSDESWRWRYEVADKWYERYWRQLINWAVERPFASRDRFVALNVDAVTYQPGEAAEITTRVQDEQGRPMFNAEVQAMLTRDGQAFGTVALEADANQGGAYRGKTTGLPPGRYDVAITVAGLPPMQMKARTQFLVQPQASQEMTDLIVNTDLLRDVATNSGGEYFGEHEIARLAQRLESQSQARVIESEVSLWDNWWWFTPIVLLLTIEWFIRKRTGLL